MVADLSVSRGWEDSTVMVVDIQYDSVGIENLCMRAVSNLVVVRPREKEAPMGEWRRKREEAGQEIGMPPYLRQILLEQMASPDCTMSQEEKLAVLKTMKEDHGEEIDLEEFSNVLNPSDE